ncbi:MAG: hypothetical protein R3B68_06255 [Phycisphaerales bacterium]
MPRNGTSRTSGKPRVLEAFEGQAAASMAALGEALAHMFDALGAPIERAVDVERALGLDKKLAWQVFGLARDRSTAQIANVPARRSMARLLEAASRHGVGDAPRAAVEQAFERFEAFTASHAGDRDVLVTMVRGIGSSVDEQAEMRLRRGLYRGNAHAWGLRMRLFVRSTIFLPGAQDGGRETPGDEIMLSAHIGLEQLRPDSRAAIISWARPSGTAHEAPARVEPTFTLHEEFCSRPLAAMRHSGVGRGVETELTLPAIGRKGATTLYTSQTLRAVGAAKGRYETNNIFCVPVERIVFDLMVPAGRGDAASAAAAIYGRPYHPEHVFEKRAADLLPQPVAATALGEVEAVPAIDGAPRHAEAVAHVLEQAGHTGARFDLYRCEVRYPVLHTMLSLGVNAAGAAGAA